MTCLCHRRARSHGSNSPSFPSHQNRLYAYINTCMYIHTHTCTHFLPFGISIYRDNHIFCKCFSFLFLFRIEISCLRSLCTHILLWLIHSPIPCLLVPPLSPTTTACFSLPTSCTLKKTHWVHLDCAWMWKGAGPSYWSMGSLSGAATLRKLTPPTPAPAFINCQWLLGDGRDFINPPPPELRSWWLCPVQLPCRSCACSHSCYEFMCGTVMSCLANSVLL